MFGAMQMYQMQAMEQHISRREARREQSATRLVRLRDIFRKDQPLSGKQRDTTVKVICLQRPFHTP